MNLFKFIIIFCFGAIFGVAIYSSLMTKVHSPSETNILGKSVTLNESKDNCCMLEEELTKSRVEQQLTYQSLEVDNARIKDRAVMFLPSVDLIKADNYDDFIGQLSSESFARFNTLNHGFYNAFKFETPLQLEAALANGFPTPEELEYVYASDINELIEDIKLRKMAIKYKDHPDYPKTEKLATLTFNRMMDEFVELVRQYRPDYQEGDPLPELIGSNRASLAADLDDSFNNVLRLRALASGNLASSYLASARFNVLNVFNYDEEEIKPTWYTELAVAEVKLKTENIRKSVWPNRKYAPPEFVAIQAGLLNVNLPNRFNPTAG